MLFALEWIREQLAVVSDFIAGILEALTLNSIGSFLTQSVALLVIYILAGLILACLGFRFHKLVSGAVGAAIMGLLGWSLGTAINPNMLSSSIVWALIFTVIGLLLFSILFVVNAWVGSFILAYTLCRELFAAGIAVGAIAGFVFALAFCFLLVKRHFIRTPIEGGIILGLISLHYFSFYVALGLVAVIITGGILLQNALRKNYEAKIREYEEYRPNAPRPPTPEEIAAEFAEESREMAARKAAQSTVPDPPEPPEPPDPPETPEITEITETSAEAAEAPENAYKLSVNEIDDVLRSIQGVPSGGLELERL